METQHYIKMSFETKHVLKLINKASRLSTAKEYQEWERKWLVWLTLLRQSDIIKVDAAPANATDAAKAKFANNQNEISRLLVYSTTTMLEETGKT